MDPALSRSRAAWNRKILLLDSDETLAQVLDRGEMDAWRALYRLAQCDVALRGRIHRLLSTAPIGMPHFWKAALESLGERVDHAATTVPLDRDWV